MTVALPPRSVLLAQVAIERGNLQRAREALAAEAIDEGLRAAVHVRFNTRLKEIERKLDGVERCAISPPLDACWSALEDAAQRSRELLAECLAFLEGALIRSAGIDRGVCAVADGLLQELSRLSEVPWARLTILGEDDRVFSLADIVRLRFPEFTVWAIPVAAHEFGHVAVRTHAGLKAKLPAWTERDPRAEELFADVFATYVLGPAFACTTVMLRFSPLDASRGARHPRDAQRVHAVLDVLDRLDKLEGDRPYALALDRLGATWEASLEAASQRPSAAEEVLRFLVDDMFANLELEVPLARYATWDQARELAGQLTARPAAADLRDVLNAAWHARLKGWHRAQPTIEELESAGLELATRTLHPAPAGAGASA